MPGWLWNRTETKIGQNTHHPIIPNTKEQRCLVGCTTKPRPAAARSRDDTGNGYFYPTCPSYFLLIKCIWVNILVQIFEILGNGYFHTTCPSYSRFLLIKCIWINTLVKFRISGNDYFYPACLTIPCLFFWLILNYGMFRNLEIYMHRLFSPNMPWLFLLLLMYLGIIFQFETLKIR